MHASVSHPTPRRAPSFALRGVRALARSASTALLVLSAVALLGIGLGPRLGFYRTLTVLSGSMQPTFAPGDVVVVTREPIRDVRPGQIITYAIPISDHHVETHRIVRVLRGGAHPVVVTKGDANRTADPWQAELNGATVWRYRFRVPVLGRAIVALRDPLVHRITVLLLPVLLALYGLARIWRRPEEASDAPARP
jgi:signal peptidase